ncbi:HNH endonuclease [Cereibacter sphaeroides]|nr:HNH endonuclease [Cereibacter sphaeroides]
MGAEKILIALVRDGEWTIKPDGTIWRQSRRIGNRHDGSSLLIPCATERAERLLPTGYLMVRAMRNGVRTNGLAHRLVWQHAHGDIPDGMQINHRNGIKDDNRPENLELASATDQAKHAHGSGLIDQTGQRNPSAKLSDRQVAQIRNAYQQGGYTMEQLGQRFGVSFQAISKIVRGKRRPKQGGPVAGDDLRHCVCEQDEATGRFIGKRVAGRLLDGVEHNGMPEVAHG